MSLTMALPTRICCQLLIKHPVRIPIVDMELYGRQKQLLRRIWMALHLMPFPRQSLPQQRCGLRVQYPVQMVLGAQDHGPASVGSTLDHFAKPRSGEESLPSMVLRPSLQLAGCIAWIEYGRSLVPMNSTKKLCTHGFIQ